MASSGGDNDAAHSSAAATAALLSTGMISLAPNLILLLFPNYAAGGGGAASSYFLRLGQAVAAGGLLGDVFLHTLPHATEASSSNEKDAIAAGVWVLIGFTIFLTADLVIRAAEDARAAGNGASDADTKTTTAIDASSSNGSHQHHGHHHHQHNASLIFLNLAADALHNFTDGLAIGTTYAAASSAHQHGGGGAATLGSMMAGRGGLASLSILFHEVPHELGDFCTLVRAGYSKSQAIAAQFATAVAAFAGTCSAFLYC